MSWVSKGLRGLGHLAEKAAPYVGLIPGVGTVAGGAIGGLGALAAGDGLGGALKYGALGAAGGYGGAALRGLSTGGKIAAVGGSLLHGGGPPSVAGDPSGGVNLDPKTGLEVQGGGNGGSGGGSSTNPWLMGLAGLEGLNSAYLGNKANKFSDQALSSVKDSYNARAPLRSAAMSGLLNPIPRDTSELTRIRSNNAFTPKPQLSLAAA